MKDIIFCLIGESGSGKTSMAKLLSLTGTNVIQSYTNRPPREENEWGHIFTNYEALRRTKKAEMIAYTFYNNFHYWATRSQYQGMGSTVYVIDPPGLELLKRNVTDAGIVAIYLRVDAKYRRQRMRLDIRPTKDINERMANDKEAFKTVVCDYCIDANRDKLGVYELIYTIIVQEGGVNATATCGNNLQSISSET